MDRVKRGRRLPAALAAALACTLAAEAAAQGCIPTMPVDTARYFNTAGGQAWQRVADYMAAAGTNFNLGVMDTQPVKLCNSGDPSCLPKVMQVRSEQRTMCLDSAAAYDGNLRIVGMVVGAGPGLLPAYGFGLDNISGGGSDRDSVYLFVRGGVVFALYRTTGDLTAFARRPAAGAPGWWFLFHAPDTPPAGTWALWKTTTLMTGVLAQNAALRGHWGGPAAPGGEDGAAAQTTLAFGWMACAAGCCQFHGTGDGNPDDEEEHGHPHHPPPPNPNPHPARRR